MSRFFKIFYPQLQNHNGIIKCIVTNQNNNQNIEDLDVLKVTKNQSVYIIFTQKAVLKIFDNYKGYLNALKEC